jgi:hypothetical protein
MVRWPNMPLYYNGSSYAGQNTLKNHFPKKSKRCRKMLLWICTSKIHFLGPHLKSNPYTTVVHKICLQQYYLNMTAADNVSGQLQQLNAANKKKPIHKSTTHDEDTSARPPPGVPAHPTIQKPRTQIACSDID